MRCLFHGLIGHRRSGFSLLEGLIALVLAGLVLSAISQILWNTTSIYVWLKKNDNLRYGAQYWFGCFEGFMESSDRSFDALQDALEEMPLSTPDGTVRFSWQALEHSRSSFGHPDMIEIILSVFTAQDIGDDLQVTRRIVLEK